MSIDNFIMTELHEAAERASKKVRDRDAMRRACDQLDVAREEIAVHLIRSDRDQ